MTYKSCPNCGCTKNLTEVIKCYNCERIVCERCSDINKLKCPYCGASISMGEGMGLIKND